MLSHHQFWERHVFAIGTGLIVSFMCFFNRDMLDYLSLMGFLLKAASAFTAAALSVF